MTISRYLGIAAVATLFASAPAFAQSAVSTQTPPSPAAGITAGNTTTPGKGPADQGMMRDMQTMQQRMSSAHMTGRPDQDFVTMMIPHHQGAVAMAHTELKYGKSPYLKKMARRIIKSQDRQIKEMKHWQAKHPNTP